MRSSSCAQTDVSSLVIVTFGAVHAVAHGEGVDGDFVAVGLGFLDGVAELEALASAEALTGSTVSWPLWAGPQALSAIPVLRHSAATRRRRRSEG